MPSNLKTNTNQERIEKAFQAYKSCPADFVPDTVVAKKYGISLSNLRNNRHLCRGLPYYKWGRMIRYRMSEIDEILSSGRIAPEEQ